jgi:hypothetical protein
MILIQNKRGGEKLLSIWWFFILAITATAIVVAVTYYYSADIDVRQMESAILAEKLGECLNNGGYLIENFTGKDFDIYRECGLSNLTFGRESRLYFNVTVVDAKTRKTLGKEIRGGDSSYEGTCAVTSSGEIEAAKYPKCTYKSEKITYYENFAAKEAYLQILAASNQYSEKVAVARGAA